MNETMWKADPPHVDLDFGTAGLPALRAVAAVFGHVVPLLMLVSAVGVVLSGALWQAGRVSGRPRWATLGRLWCRVCVAAVVVLVAVRLVM